MRRLILILSVLLALPAAAIERLEPGKAVTLPFDSGWDTSTNSDMIDGSRCGFVQVAIVLDTTTAGDTTFAGAIESGTGSEGTWSTAQTIAAGTFTLPSGRHLFRVNPSAAPASGSNAEIVFRCQQQFSLGFVTEDMTSGGYLIYDGPNNRVITNDCTTDLTDLNTIDCPADDDAGQSITLKEDTDHGSNTLTISVGSTNLSGNAVRGPDTSGRLDADTVRATVVVTFCGEGPGAGGTVYMGPATPVDALGSAACDALGNATLATVDAVPPNLHMAYDVSQMWCTCTGGTDDSLAFTVMDDTVANTVTCSDTAPAPTCEASLVAAETVAAGSAVAVRVVGTGDDDMSGEDCFCWVAAGL